MRNHDGRLLVKNGWPIYTLNGTLSSLTRQAALLGLHRAGLYYVPRPVSAAEVAIKHAIDEIYTAYPFYGSRRMAVELRGKHQLPVARETGQRYMREMGLTAIYPGRKLRRHNPEHKVYPYLLRNITAAYPNPVWGIDSTYIRLRGGWLYRVAGIDWFSVTLLVGKWIRRWRCPLS